MHTINLIIYISPNILTNTSNVLIQILIDFVSISLDNTGSYREMFSF